MYPRDCVSKFSRAFLLYWISYIFSYFFIFEFLLNDFVVTLIKQWIFCDKSNGISNFIWSCIFLARLTLTKALFVMKIEKEVSQAFVTSGSSRNAVRIRSSYLISQSKSMITKSLGEFALFSLFSSIFSLSSEFVLSSPFTTFAKSTFSTISILFLF